jgi:hypothetical protein
LLLLGQSSIQRLDRALRARDRLLEQFQGDADRDAIDEALFHLDVVLLMLSGSLDATARVAHIAYGFGRSSLNNAGWRKDHPWLERLAESDRQLADSVNPGTTRRDIIDIVGLLRNTIHGEALQGLTAHDEQRPLDPENLVRLPQRQERRLLAALNRCGGQAAWGVRDVGGGFLTLEADTFVEALVAKSATAINGLMAETDYGRLLDGDTELLPGPPDDHPFSDWMTRNVLALAGLSAP